MGAETPVQPEQLLNTEVTALCLVAQLHPRSTWVLGPRTLSRAARAARATIDLSLGPHQTGGP